MTVTAPVCAVPGCMRPRRPRSRVCAECAPHVQAVQTATRDFVEHSAQHVAQRVVNHVADPIERRVPGFRDAAASLIEGWKRRRRGSAA